MQEQTLQKREKLLAFSERLKQLASRKGIRQKRIADLLGDVEPSAVGQWFRARNFPGPSVEYRLADILGVHRDWLIEGRDTLQKQESGNEVQESPAAYNAPPLEDLKRQVRARFELALTVASGQLSRLGYLNEILRTAAAHWQPELGEGAEPLGTRARAQEMRDRAASFPAGRERKVLIEAAALLDEDESAQEAIRARRQRDENQSSA